jgi:uncharacterized protein YndB with AHSA1/START domain
MTETLAPITRSVTVRCSAERAFELFTARMDAWWPVETHSRAAMEHEDEGLKVERIEFQGRVGGQVLEHMSDGEARSWGEILTWEPPRRFVLAWKPHPRPDPPTEVEVRFDPAGEGTEVVLVHRAWERLIGIRPDLDTAHAGYAAGWVRTLERFAEAADRDAA